MDKKFYSQNSILLNLLNFYKYEMNALVYHFKGGMAFAFLLV